MQVLSSAVDTDVLVGIVSKLKPKPQTVLGVVVKARVRVPRWPSAGVECPRTPPADAGALEQKSLGFWGIV